MSSPADEAHWKPGWYAHPDMVNTTCFWDGTTWTDKVAPLAPAPPEVQRVTFTGEQILAFLLFLTLIGLAILLVLFAVDRA